MSNYYCHTCGGHVSLREHRYCEKLGLADTCYGCQNGRKLLGKDEKNFITNSN